MLLKWSVRPRVRLLVHKESGRFGTKWSFSIMPYPLVGRWELSVRDRVVINGVVDQRAVQ